jgi:hypothetical protein
MSSFLATLVVVSMLATLGVLVTGLAGFFQGGEFNRRFGNRLMRWRVGLQGLTLLLVMLWMMSQG